MQPERLPQLTLAQGLVEAVEELIDLGRGERRKLLSEFTDILRPVCKAAEEAYKRGFDDGADYMGKRRR